METDNLHAKDFFVSLKGKLNGVSEECLDEVFKHVDYLANKAGVGREQVFLGNYRAADNQVIAEAIQNIKATLVVFGIEDENESVDDFLQKAERLLDGWCSREKSKKIVDLIQSEQLKNCVEIGVFGGRSLVPAAWALKKTAKGSITGIESWSNTVATEFIIGDTNDEWWRNVDFFNVKRRFYQFIVNEKLTDYIKILEAPASRVDSCFSTIDYLHIDGSHSTYHACEDVVRYSKKVKKGGFIIMDDADWKTTEPALRILYSICERIDGLKNEEGLEACTFFRKL